MSDPSPNPPQRLPARSDMLTARLAQELAANLLTPQEIAQGFNLTIAQLKEIIHHPQFREMYKEAKVAWNGGMNAKDRTRFKADAIVEDSLLAMVNIINDTDSKTSQIDAFKQVVAVSNFAPKNAAKSEADAGEKFILNISLANTDKPIIIEGTPHPEEASKD